MKVVILEANKNLNVTETRIPEIKPDECLLKVKRYLVYVHLTFIEL